MKILKESIEVHDSLNSSIWNSDNTLRADVHDAIINIVKKYIEESEVLKENDIIDIELVGSNASFNYTADSDLDIHIVVNMESLTCDAPLMQLACNAEKAQFNKNFNIKLKGVDVELYVEDVKASTASNSVYSVYKEEWIKFPQPIPVIDYETDPAFVSLFTEWRERAESLLNEPSDSKEIQEYINSIYNLRRQSIMIEGEFGIGNLVFKEIRNVGLLQKLKDELYKVSSQELTLENMNEDCKMKKYRVNYLIDESFHYSLMEADTEMVAAQQVYDYVDSNYPGEYEFLGVEEVKEGPESGAPFGLSELLIQAINGEWDTISLYNGIALAAEQEGMPEIKAIIDHINEEEAMHVGELQEALKTLSPNVTAIEDGEKDSQEELEIKDVEGSVL